MPPVNLLLWILSGLAVHLGEDYLKDILKLAKDLVRLFKDNKDVSKHFFALEQDLTDVLPTDELGRRVYNGIRSLVAPSSIWNATIDPIKMTFAEAIFTAGGGGIGALMVAFNTPDLSVDGLRQRLIQSVLGGKSLYHRPSQEPNHFRRMRALAHMLLHMCADGAIDLRVLEGNDVEWNQATIVLRSLMGQHFLNLPLEFEELLRLCSIATKPEYQRCIMVGDVSAGKSFILRMLFCWARWAVKEVTPEARDSRGGIFGSLDRIMQLTPADRALLEKLACIIEGLRDEAIDLFFEGHPEPTRPGIKHLMGQMPLPSGKGDSTSGRIRGSPKAPLGISIRFLTEDEAAARDLTYPEGLADLAGKRIVLDTFGMSVGGDQPRVAAAAMLFMGLQMQSNGITQLGLTLNEQEQHSINRLTDQFKALAPFFAMVFFPTPPGVAFEDHPGISSNNHAKRLEAQHLEKTTQTLMVVKADKEEEVNAAMNYLPPSTTLDYVRAPADAPRPITLSGATVLISQELNYALTPTDSGLASCRQTERAIHESVQEQVTKATVQRLATRTGLPELQREVLQHQERSATIGVRSVSVSGIVGLGVIINSKKPVHPHIVEQQAFMLQVSGTTYSFIHSSSHSFGPPCRSRALPRPWTSSRRPRTPIGSPARLSKSEIPLRRR